MRKFVLLALMACVAGCATTTSSTEPSWLSIERGPCFGFCPVYRVAILDDTRVEFVGIRHTATLGRLVRKVDASKLAEVKREFEAYRPSTGAELDCGNASTDQAVYLVHWRGDPLGADLTFNSGCSSAKARALKSLLEELPTRLDIEQDARQVTRPGASRG